MDVELSEYTILWPLKALKPGMLILDKVHAAVAIVGEWDESGQTLKTTRLDNGAYSHITYDPQLRVRALEPLNSVILRSVPYDASTNPEQE